MRRKTPSKISENTSESGESSEVRRLAPLLNREGVGGGRTTSKWHSTIRRRLLAWFDKHKRDLPWRRREHDPYAQWVAEIMLQQTRVETVLRFYDRFLSRFPDVRSLAAAEHQEVLKLWEGLGYYRRILNLHRAAQVVAESGGSIPVSASDLRELPGVGRYTAAAIASIAYGEVAAAVDGNVMRVIGRLLGLKDVLSAAARARIQSEADALISRTRPGDFNQAWMDLGSSICTPRDPLCAKCPLQNLCATGQGSGERPSRFSARPVPVKTRVAVEIVLRGNHMLVRQRPLGGLWSGLWEFLSVEMNGTGRADALIGQAGSKEKVGTLQHRLTHRLITFHIYESTAERAEKLSDESSRWVTQEDFKQLPVSTAHRRIHALWVASRERGSKPARKAREPATPRYARAPAH